MTAQNDSTIAGLARGIENAAEAIADLATESSPDTEPEPPRDQLRIIEDLDDRIRWAKAAIDMIA